jgi:Fe-S-cluster containining protein
MPKPDVIRQLNCNGCVACCIGENIVLTEKQARDYETETLEDGRLVVAHKDDGKCVYLSSDGCSIYERRPGPCKSFSCVWMARTLGIKVMQKMCSAEVIQQAIFRVREINRAHNQRRKKMLYKPKPRKGKPIKKKGSE